MEQIQKRKIKQRREQTDIEELPEIVDETELNDKTEGVLRHIGKVLNEQV